MSSGMIIPTEFAHSDWKMPSNIGTRVFGQLQYRTRSRSQRDHPTTLHALGFKRNEDAVKARIIVDKYRHQIRDSTAARHSRPLRSGTGARIGFAVTLIAQSDHSNLFAK
jgi:hypothetical protein